MNNQNEEINLSNESLKGNKHVLNLKEAKTKKMFLKDRENSKLPLPQDDTFVEMGIYAKNLTMPDKIRKRLSDEYDAQGKKVPDTLGFDLIKDKISEVDINGTNYIIREVINESDGFQAIVFENSNTHECTFTIAGSYSLTKPLLNPAEWYKDWVQNNIAIGFKHLPPQLETAIRTLDKCKEKYNITSITGYSLGAILAGLLAQFKRNKHLKTYLYNGGLPQKLVNTLREKYGDEIDLDESLNMVTMLSNGELVTDLLTIVRGAGIFMLKGGKAGHELENLKDTTKKSYKEIDQAGIAIIDGLKDNLTNSTIGNGVMYSLEIPLDSSQTVKKEKAEETENTNVNSTDTQNGNKPYIEGHVEENVYKDSTENDSKENPTGYAANMPEQNDTVKTALPDGIADSIERQKRELQNFIDNVI